MLEGRIERQGGATARDREVDPDQRGIGARCRARTHEAADEDRGRTVVLEVQLRQGRVVLEGVGAVPRALGLRDPELDPAERWSRSQLGVADPPAGRHQVQLPRAYHLLGAERIGVERLALEQPRGGRQPDVGVGSDLQGIGFLRVRGADDVHEAPGTDGPAALGGKHPRHGEAADLGVPALAQLDGFEGLVLALGVGRWTGPFTTDLLGTERPP